MSLLLTRRSATVRKSEFGVTSRRLDLAKFFAPAQNWTGCNLHRLRTVSPHTVLVSNTPAVSIHSLLWESQSLDAAPHDPLAAWAAARSRSDRARRRFGARNASPHLSLTARTALGIRILCAEENGAAQER
jgi:hypothetical protein